MFTTSFAEYQLGFSLFRHNVMFSFSFPEFYQQYFFFALKRMRGGLTNKLEIRDSVVKKTKLNNMVSLTHTTTHTHTNFFFSKTHTHTRTHTRARAHTHTRTHTHVCVCVLSHSVSNLQKHQCRVASVCLE